MILEKMMPWLKILQNQCTELAGILVLGQVLAQVERKIPARTQPKYQEFWTDVLAMTVLFFEAGTFIALIEVLRSLEFLKPVQTAVQSVPFWVLIPATSLSSDLLNYFIHRLLHSDPMWRFHRWHHSPNQLFWFTGFRGGFVHIFALGFKNILLLSISNLNPWVLATLGVQGILVQMLGHVNFDIHIPFLSKIIVMPQYHRIHHATDRKLHDNNYGFFWTFWDRIFRTQVLPESVPEKFPIGIPESEKVAIWKMLIG